MPDLAILTNAHTADQRSMLGYGDLLLDNARGAGLDVRELRASSLLGRLAPGRTGSRSVANLLANLDRFVTAPLAFAGRRADVVHVVDPGNALYLDVIRHKASIVTVHDVIPYLCLADKLQGFKPSTTGRWLMRRILKRLGRVDRIVCDSDCTRRDLLSLAPIESARVEVIPIPVFQPMHRSDDNQCRALRGRLGLPMQGPIILHVGSNSFYKNRRTVADVFVRVAPEVPDAVLLFVGPPTPDLTDRIAPFGLKDRVHFAPSIDRDDMAAVYSTASVLLFPSLYEGFGYPVLEAQLCGTPVVCSDAGSLPEVAGDGAIKAHPTAVEALAQAVLRLLRDQQFAQNLRTAGGLNARRFIRAGWAERHRTLYAALAENPAGRARQAGLRPT